MLRAGARGAKMSHGLAGASNPKEGGAAHGRRDKLVAGLRRCQRWRGLALACDSKVDAVLTGGPKSRR